jgi:tetratricopeptide (TPR) repeat protein
MPMRRIAVIAMIWVSGVFASHAAQAYDFCASAKECNDRGLSDVAAGKYQDALDAFLAAADLATGAGDNDTLLSAFEQLTAVNLKLGKPLMAHAWAQAALVAFDKDARALKNLEAAQQALQASPLPTGITGTYDSYAGYGYWSELKIVEQEDGKVQTDWFMMRFGAVPSAFDYGPAAMWELSADGSFANGELVLTYEGMDGASCQFTFKRIELAIELVSPQPEDLSQNCQTGGAGVFPWGPFWLVDTAIPSLEDTGGTAD